MVGKQVFSSLRPSRKTRKVDENTRQQLLLEVNASKPVAQPVPSTPQSRPLSGYFYPWSPSSLDLLVRVNSKTSKPTEDGDQSPTLSLDLPDSTFGTLFQVPRRKPIPQSSAPSSISSRRSSANRTVRSRSSVDLSSTVLDPGSLEWPIPVFDVPSPSSIEIEIDSSRSSSLDSLDIPIPVVELPVEMDSSSPPMLAQPLNKPSFRTFCRNRLMLYSPVAENPFVWTGSSGRQMVATTC